MIKKHFSEAQEPQEPQEISTEEIDSASDNFISRLGLALQDDPEVSADFDFSKDVQQDFRMEYRKFLLRRYVLSEPR